MTERLRLRVRSERWDEVVDSVHRIYPDLRVLRGSRSDAAGRFLQNVDGDGTLAYHRVETTMPTRQHGDIAGQVLVNTVRGGGLRMLEGRDEIDTTRPFLHPVERLESEWDAFRLEAVSLSAEALRCAAAAITDEPDHRVVFFGHVPVDAAMERRWREVQRQIAGVLTDPHLAGDELVRGRTVRMAAAAVLAAFPNSTMRARRPGIRSDVAAAVAFIEAHAMEDIGLAEIAAAAGVPGRSLTAAFRERFGRTVLQYLRDERHRRVRDELRDADPHGPMTVAAVARRWGFAHLGRFAGDYAARFGESPSTTLRR
jgi:AraC-like DNA-binding protein